MQQPCRTCPKKLHCSNALWLMKAKEATGGRFARTGINPSTVATNPRTATIFLKPTALSMATGDDLLRRKLGATIFAARHERNEGRDSQ
jgi:hypothetical protein